jgi:23S rRNA G2069 N7-methylase RlmK/C1962 C5-methylase RlmI
MIEDPRGLKGFVTPEKEAAQARVFANSLINRFRHFSKKYRRQNIDVFRLYDWDSPDIRLVVDWYSGYIVVAEYERKQTLPEYLPRMAKAAALALSVPEEKVFIKRRHTNTEDGPRYTKIESRNEKFTVNERDLKFWVNLSDFLDTGLYSDHRDTRVIISKLSAGKDFLNLFAYTGAFTCAAALGRAKTTVTVDRSKTYIDWAKDNLVLNGIKGPEHVLLQSDVARFLSAAHRDGKKFDLAFVDPPSFYNDEREQEAFDVNLDHPALLEQALRLMRPGGDLFFSTNHQRFEPKFEGLAVKEIIKLTPKTIPEDYRNKNVHNCWRMKV